MTVSLCKIAAKMLLFMDNFNITQLYGRWPQVIISITAAEAVVSRILIRENPLDNPNTVIQLTTLTNHASCYSLILLSVLRLLQIRNEMWTK